MAKRWQPMLWPSAAGWEEPSALALVENTPINCVILKWDGASKLLPLVAEGRRRGLTLIALLDEPGARARAEAAKTAGFDGIAGPFPEDSMGGLPVIPWVARADLPRSSQASTIAVTGNVWPSAKISMRGQRDAADAGPTGVPWVDSNGWFVQLARELAPDRVIWIVAEPPSGRMTMPAETYALAAADSAAYGAEWVISLGSEMAGRLASADPSAISDWKRFAARLRFFPRHEEWRSYRPLGAVGVLSDFHGANEFLSTEALNLLARRHLPFRILEKSKLRKQRLSGVKALIYVDEDLPAPALRTQMLEFVRAGGLLICGKASAPLAAGGAAVDEPYPRFDVRRLGKGRVAVSTEEQIDPYMLAGDSHILLSRRNDLVRLFNAGPGNSYYAGSPDGRKAVFGVLDYTRRPNEALSLQFTRAYRTARFWSLDSEAAVQLELVKRGPEMVEAGLPQFSVYCAVELEA
jgi:hypothetical protein